MADTEKRIQVKYILDSTGFNESLQGVNSELKVNQAELKNAQVGLKAFGDTTQNLTRVQQALSTQIETQSRKVGVYSDALDKAYEKMKKNAAARDELKTSIDMEKAKLEGAINAYGQESEVVSNVQAKIAELTKEYEGMNKACETNAKSVNTATVNMEKAEAELTRLKGQLIATNEQLAKNNNAWINTGKNLESVGGKLTKVGSAVDSVGNTMLGLSAPIIAATAVGTKFSMDFQDGLAKINTIADTTQMSIDDIGKGVVELSNKTGKSTSDLNEALYQAISSGVQTGDTLQFMNTAAKAAIGGFTDTETAVDGLTTVLNSYGLKASEVNDIANQMMIAQNLGKTTLGQLATEMGNVTPISSALGVSTKELFSSLAVLTANGIQTGEAITGLKSAMSNIIKPSDQAVQAAKSLGIQFDANTVKSKGWLSFLTEVKDKLSQASPEFAKASEEVNKLTARQTALEKAGKKSSDEYKNNAAALKSAKDEMSNLAQASNGQLSAFATMFGSVEGLNSVLTLTSKQGMELYNTSLAQMGSGTDYISDAFNKVNNTDGKNLEKTLNELKNSTMKLGEAATPIISDVTSLIQKLTNTLNGMNEGQIKAVEDAGLLMLGIGLVGKAAGGLITTVGNVTKVIGGLSKAFGEMEVASATAEAAGAATAELGAGAAAGSVGLAGLGTALGGVAVAAAPWLLAGAAVVEVGVGINHELSQETIPTVDLFADKVEMSTKKIKDSNAQLQQSYETTVTKISDNTKKSVGAYISMDDNVKKTLTDLYINSTTITSQTVQSLVSKYNDMGTKIKAGMDKHYNDEYTTMQQFFQKSKALTDVEEADALAKLQTDKNNKKVKIEQYEQQIQQILQNAANQHRSLTLQEQQDINSIQDKMKTNAVNALSDSEVQSKIILQRLKDYGTRVTTEQASEVIQNANKQRDGAVNAANEQYNKTLAAIIQMRDGTHSITSDQADKLIADAKRQRDESVNHAEGMRNEVVGKLKQMDPDVESQVNTTTGKIKTAWDNLKSWWDNLWFNKKDFQIDVSTNTNNNISSSYADMKRNVGHNATGTQYWRGGLTTKDENGYELYDLPQGTRIYNHDASEDLVKQTAESVARNVLSNIQISSSMGDISITSPMYFDGKLIGTQNNRIQGNMLKKGLRGKGLK